MTQLVQDQHFSACKYRLHHYSKPTGRFPRSRIAKSTAYGKVAYPSTPGEHIWLHDPEETAGRHFSKSNFVLRESGAGRGHLKS